MLIHNLLPNTSSFIEIYRNIQDNLKIKTILGSNKDAYNSMISNFFDSLAIYVASFYGSSDIVYHDNKLSYLRTATAGSRVLILDCHPIKESELYLLINNSGIVFSRETNDMFISNFVFYIKTYKNLSNYKRVICDDMKDDVVYDRDSRLLLHKSSVLLLGF